MSTQQANSESGGDAMSRFAICNLWLEDERVDLEIADTTVAAILPAGSSERCDDEGAVDATGQWAVPSFIDSHVHLAYYPVADKLARSGIAAAVDLAVPFDSMPGQDSPLRQLVSGPMLTAPAGYPTQSWGANGYGLEVDGPQAGRSAVEQLVAAGAGVVKIPFVGQAQLDDESVLAIVEAASEAQLPVVAHAMDDSNAMRAREFGIDILAHTPTSPLSPLTVQAWADGTVITTLAAFGDDADARVNLAALRSAGTRVLYGTDLGNSRELGVQALELEALLGAGFDGAEIVEMGTRRAASFWGWSDLGSIEVGKRASLMLVADDPRVDPMVLSEPEAVLLDGVWQELLPPPPSLPGVGGP